MHSFIHSSKSCGAGVCAGPLSAYVEAFCFKTESLGYSPRTCAYHRLLLGQLDLWLARHGLGLADVDERLIERFLPCATRHQRLSARAPLRRFLTLLREDGVIGPAKPPEALCPAEALVRQYRHFLTHERGLLAESVCCHARVARRFLSARFGAGALDLAQLRAQELFAFVRDNARSFSRGHTSKIVCCLRCFLRFARLRGYIGDDLAALVPRPACWKLAGLPRALGRDEVEKVLRCCDRKSAPGMRDYAVLILLARLGLRAGEVAAMQLEDIDWARAELTVRSKKGGGLCRLPLPGEVGAALARYLRHARPKCASRHVFVCMRGAPRQGFSGRNPVGVIVRRSLVRAGVHAPRRGAHAFRHALARDLLKNGASLEQIGRVLRHKDPEATAIYAKVDFFCHLQRPRPDAQANALRLPQAAASRRTAQARRAARPPVA